METNHVMLYKHLPYSLNTDTITSHKRPHNTKKATCSRNIAEKKMLTNSTQLTGCQVGHVDLVGKSNVCGIMVEGVAVAKPIELEGEVDGATDG